MFSSVIQIPSSVKIYLVLLYNIIVQKAILIFHKFFFYIHGAGSDFGYSYTLFCLHTFV
nr:MAG TPA: hypothetical protein [Caudoviricetes sp.]